LREISGYATNNIRQLIAVFSESFLWKVPLRFSEVVQAGYLPCLNTDCCGRIGLNTDYGLEEKEE